MYTMYTQYTLCTMYTYYVLCWVCMKEGCTIVPHIVTITVPSLVEKAMPVAITTTTIFRLTQNSHPAVLTAFCNLIFLRASTLKVKVKVKHMAFKRFNWLFTWWVGHVFGDEVRGDSSADDDDDVAGDANEPCHVKSSALTTGDVVGGLGVCSGGRRCYTCTCYTLYNVHAIHCTCYTLYML